MPETLPDFPPEALPVFERLLALELQPVSVLEDQVDRHLQDLERAQETNEFLDVATARHLAASARQLLAGYLDAHNPQQLLPYRAALVDEVQDLPESALRLRDLVPRGRP